MPKDKIKQEKTRLHPRNKNRERYDLAALLVSNPELVNHMKPNKYGEDSIDFADPSAVKLLNKALLNHYYGIANWDFPDTNLCPPIPGRADYIHHIADLLCESNFGNVPTGDKITCFDIGVGANCIYPIIGVTEYGWKFIGSDIDPKSIESAQNIVDANPTLEGKIELRLQPDRRDVFYGVIDKEERIDLCVCNPPFHASAEEAEKGSRRKVKNLTGKKVETPVLNFAGISDELICEGGEYKFILNMIKESRNYLRNFFWFSTLVSKKSNVKSIFDKLKDSGAKSIRTIPMGTGNKSSQVIAWTFLTKDEQKEWRETRWEVI
ncbi:MAG: 23S rRNA (adenine(1618)-N(6))-methyltransferase RlmF [Candidatus Kapaibacterium sp.]